MVPSISRQSVILKCLRKKSALLGNYELYYLAGLSKKLYNLNLEATMQPQALYDSLKEQTASLEPEDEREKYMLQMIKSFEPLEEYNDDMVYLFRWGETEPDLWQVNTGYEPE